MKIVVLDGNVLNPGDLSWKALESLGELVLYDRTKESQIIERIADAEVVFTNKTPIRKQTLDKISSVRFIGVLATGYDVVDYRYAKEKGIVVTNIPAYSTTAVAQMVFALLLEVCHHVGAHNKLVKEGKWTTCLNFSFWDYPLIELSGKTLGIIGFGNIGKNVAKIANSFGMNVKVYTRTIKKELETKNLTFVSLAELYNQSDIISIHCPLQEENKGFINRSSIDKMKDHVIIINTARGALINDVDLKEALDTGKVYYAAVDVLESEPAKKDNPLLTAKNCLITPHIAWATKEARQRLMDIAVTNLTQYQKGQAINVVNK